MQRSERNSSFTVFLQVATLVSIFAAIVINALSNAFPVGGLNIGAIANTILGGVLITPQNYAFAIWGVIYIGLIGFGIYQFLPSQRFNSHLLKLRAPIIWASVFQIVWVYLFQFRQFWLSVLFMFGILLNLVAAYIWSRFPKNRVSREEKWLARIPIGIYLGWISVASIVNVASALYASGWNGFGISPVIWTVLMILIAAVISAIIAIRYGDIAFTGVIVWAFVAIAVRQFAQIPILIAAIGSSIVLVLLLIFRNRPRGA
ncbi:tryptophan-rich sensory protein [Leptolyngbya sp. AN03gr2]|uniref:tryptophan-rich sensory protein n=1 Tax=unclassified Leptolyngbya TaxID=2650499 RepID=UPI003D31E110